MGFAAEAYPVDVSQRESVDRLVEHVVSATGGWMWC